MITNIYNEIDNQVSFVIFKIEDTMARIQIRPNIVIRLTIGVTCIVVLYLYIIVRNYYIQKQDNNPFFNKNLSKYKIETFINPRINISPSLVSYYNLICKLDKEKTERLKNVDSETQNSENLKNLFNNFVMSPYNGRCTNIQRFGGRYLSMCHYWDGHKFLCIDEVHKDIEQNECLVYSFGVSDDWSFEKLLGRVGCKVLAFDPTVNLPNRLENNVLFEKIGLSALKDASNSLDTLSSILQKHGHSKSKITYLKIDIEGYEVDGLLQWLESGALDNVQQIGLEYHLPDTETTLKFFYALIKLYFEGNFRVISYDLNGCATKQPNHAPKYAEILLMKPSEHSICIEKSTLELPSINTDYQLP